MRATDYVRLISTCSIALHHRKSTPCSASAGRVYITDFERGAGLSAVQRQLLSGGKQAANANDLLL